MASTQLLMRSVPPIGALGGSDTAYTCSGAYSAGVEMPPLQGALSKGAALVEDASVPSKRAVRTRGASQPPAVRLPRKPPPKTLSALQAPAAGVVGATLGDAVPE